VFRRRGRLRPALHGATPARFHPRTAQLRHSDVPRAPGRSDNRIRNGQAQSRAHDLIAGTVESIEHRIALVFGDSGPRIVDAESDAISGSSDADRDFAQIHLRICTHCR